MPGSLGGPGGFRRFGGAGRFGGARRIPRWRRSAAVDSRGAASGRHRQPVRRRRLRRSGPLGASAGGGGFGPGAGGGFGGFGAFGGGQSLGSALSYIRAHGGGTLAVSSQTTAETAIIDSDARVAGIGGFSGNESEVTAGWLAQEIRSGKIRWVLDDEGGFGGGFGGISGGRVGSRDAMQWVSEACRRATTADGSALYDCSGRAAQILQVAGKS